MPSDDSDDDDDFVSYGTALEPLDEDARPKKKAFSDQVAVDSRGRRRFHGAFTGGFSAGFMNTVGTLEGWKPSEFKSSRSERGKNKDQMPEDFMDDEDMGEFGIAPKRLTARPDFANAESSRKRRAPDFNEGPIPGVPVLEQLLQNVRETVGIRLLKEMGWKPGQGIGPRVDFDVRVKEERTYGCELPPSNDEDYDDLMSTLSFAPKDVEVYIVNPKKNTFGLGYFGLDRRSVFECPIQTTNLKTSDKNRKVNIRGQAFGVGAFEEEDDDIYSREDMSQYDFTIDNDKKGMPSISSPSASGFLLSHRKVLKKNFPLPVLPQWFQGKHEKRKSRFEPSKIEKPNDSHRVSGLGRHDVNASTRAAILNETRNFSIPPPALPQATDDVTSRTEAPIVSIPTSSTSGFQPFLHDPAKQKRYEQYILLTDKSLLARMQPVDLADWERQRERKEFEQAMKIFKPLTGVMEDRFTSAQQPDDALNPLAKVEKMEFENEQKRNAAKSKMYGALTREETDWTPSSLLCKRFNVPEPGFKRIVEEKKRPKYSIFDSLDALVKVEPPEREITSQQNTHIDPPPGIAEGSVLAAFATSQNKVSTNDDSVGDIVEVAVQPVVLDKAAKVDLFKAVFLDSSDDEADNNPPSLPEISFEEPVKNIARNTSPPRGIFANLDLSAIGTTIHHQDSIEEPVASLSSIPQVPTTPDTTAQNTTEFACVSDEMYGPKLPVNFTNPVDVQKVCSSSSDDGDLWQEIVRSASSRKHKKDKKKKKHKAKKQKKKHKR